MQNTQNKKVNQRQNVSRETIKLPQNVTIEQIKHELFEKKGYMCKARAVYQRGQLLFYVVHHLSHQMIYDIPDVTFENVIIFNDDENVITDDGIVPELYQNMYDLVNAHYPRPIGCPSIKPSLNEVIQRYIDRWYDLRFVHYDPFMKLYC